MQFKILIAVVSLLVSIVYSKETNIEGKSSDEISVESASSSQSEEDITPEDIILENLRVLLRNGDDELGLVPWAPYVDENILVE